VGIKLAGRRFGGDKAGDKVGGRFGGDKAGGRFGGEAMVTGVGASEIL
jgi:hypothetical protein